MSTTSRAGHDSGDWFFRLDLPRQEPGTTDGLVLPQFEECYDDHPWQLPQELVRGGPAVVPALRRVQRLSECRRGTNFTFPTSTWRFRQLYSAFKSSHFVRCRPRHILTPSTPAVKNCCCSKAPAPYWFNPSFLIFDIRTLWRSVLSARASECHKLKMVG